MRIAVKMLAALVMLLAFASIAEAFDQTTRWYSLNVETAPNGRPLFLTNTPDGVKLQPYRSGDPTQMWAIVQPDYPTAPAVTGSGIGPSDCISTSGIGCPFAGHASVLTRIVNRGSGGCLLFQGSGASTSTCTTLNAKTAAKQKWQYLRGAASETFFTAHRCLTAVSSRYDPDNLAVAPSDCHGDAWITYFAIQMSGEISCHTDWPYNLCFVEGQD
jgi:hypothetical protein